GNMALQMMLGLVEPGVSNDRLLNGPTNVVWIDPWVAYLRQRGVDFHFNAPAIALHCTDGRIRSVTVQENEQPIEVTADYYLVCVPVEAMARLLQDDVYVENGETRYRNVLEADPSLAGILELSQNVAWMNGIQFYLRRDVPIARGHTMYLDSPWALTSISQHQFWPHIDLSHYGDGTIQGILSVDISNWDVPGILYGKPAELCTIEEIKAETWAQLKRSLNGPGREVLRDEDLHSAYVDTDIQPSEVPDEMDTDAEPLLINKVNTWSLRPGAFTRLPNLFLAADYVRTNTQLATMEAANEAARRAVNAILNASGSKASLCEIWSLHEPAVLAPWRWYDQWRFRRGLPWNAPLPSIILLAYAASRAAIHRTADTVRQALPG
ncbi:MAG: FAD-dependent oxidoreductase, partial [Chloroflexota bacterium]|nr:FAD-dependent oxidoreductase [Chloroflexota bacterium]